MTANTNPGNFANRPKEEVKKSASKGGQASHSGGFASMPKEKLVCLPPEPYSLTSITYLSPLNPPGLSFFPQEGLTPLTRPHPSVTYPVLWYSNAKEAWHKQQEVASKGGKASSGSFEKGSEAAREAGRKGGKASHGLSDE